MPDTPANTSDTPGPTYEPRNLPVIVDHDPGLQPAGGWLRRIVRALFGWRPESLRSGLRDVLEDEGASGFSPLERTMLTNILALRERRISDVRVPRADIVAVQQDISLGELIRVFEKAEHSRLVVYNDTLDDPIGMVHIRDLIAFITARAAAPPARPAKTAAASDPAKPAKPKRRRKPLVAGLDLKAIDLSTPLSSTQIVRDMLFTPPSMRCIDLLARMQATRIHLALVVDEYGGTEGLISIEDIVEEIVGDIADEHDDDEAPQVIRQNDGSFIVDARANLEDVMRIVGSDFDPGETAEDVDTLGGYLTARVGRVPVRGEIVPGPGQFEIEVLDADPRRVKRAQIFRLRDRQIRRRAGSRQPPDSNPASGETPPHETASDAASGTGPPSASATSRTGSS
jgi:CBS domain containing-hemolysin-like protein